MKLIVESEMMLDKDGVYKLKSTVIGTLTSAIFDRSGSEIRFNEAILFPFMERLVRMCSVWVGTE